MHPYINTSINPSVNTSTHQPINPYTHQPINTSTNHSDALGQAKHWGPGRTPSPIHVRQTPMALQHRPASSRAFDWLRSPTVPPPLAWGPDYVRDFFGKLFQNLEPLEVQETFAYLRGLVFPWSSACSGTDSPAWVFGGLRDVLAASGMCTISRSAFQQSWTSRSRTPYSRRMHRGSCCATSSTLQGRRPSTRSLLWQA